MTEAMIIEAVSSAGIRGVDPMMGAQAVQASPDPAAVAEFQATMSPEPVAEIPFADSAARSWAMAHDNNQGIIHRIRALSELSAERALSAPELYELQYEVANLSFQQEVVAKVADKASQAVQTLIKNQ
ncbi:MAG: type III secretion system inner rod subunit SctI [Kiritimatiellae bacterium]|nr:type III secretion system inner rod subunit SctI [Kiritimatiellia bacterium]